MSMLALVQQTQVTKLRAALGRNVRRCEAFGSDDIKQALQALLLNPPSVLVVLAGIRYEKISMATGVKFKAIATWDVMLSARNLRGDSAEREGDALTVGAYALIEVVRNTLMGKTFGLPIEAFQPKALNSQPDDALKALVYHYLFENSWTETEAVSGDEETDLYRIHTQILEETGAAGEDLITVQQPPP